MELVYGSHGIYTDSSYESYEFSSADGVGRIKVRPVATTE